MKDALLLDIATAADRCGLPQRTMYSLIVRGEILAVRIGRRRYVRPDALGRFIDAHEAPRARAKRAPRAKTST